jgi:hypothetical protein
MAKTSKPFDPARYLKTDEELAAYAEEMRGQTADGLTCPNCNGSVMVRNPTGSCDHLYWPDLLTPEAKKKIGQTELDRIQGEYMREMSRALQR